MIKDQTSSISIERQPMLT